MTNGLPDLRIALARALLRSVIDREGGKADVKVHQLVKSLGGDVLSDTEVWHVHTIVDGLIERMDLKETEASPGAAPSAAFAKQ